LPDSIPASAPRENGNPETGTITCLNVYKGLKPWPEGIRITDLRVIQLFPKATFSMDYPNIGVASESLARGVLGTVPVEEDGSVRFTAPARKAIYFQALDENGLAVQSMMSAAYVHPGEQLACQGCHERRQDAPAQPAKPLFALRRSPSQLKPDVEGTYPLSFPRLVQPVLDRSCVPCHQKDETGKAPDLAGTPLDVSAGKKRPVSQWSRSFLSLKGYANGSSGKPPDRQPVRTTPGKFGAQASKLYQMLKQGHHDLKLSDEDMHRITVWLDCNSNFYGAYHDTERQMQGERVMPVLE
jgi:cytochrome c553